MVANLGDLIEASAAEQARKASCSRPGSKKPGSKKAVEKQGMAQKWSRINTLRDFS